MIDHNGYVIIDLLKRRIVMAALVLGLKRKNGKAHISGSCKRSPADRIDIPHLCFIGDYMFFIQFCNGQQVGM